jgi:hypothetical protein
VCIKRRKCWWLTVLGGDDQTPNVVDLSSDDEPAPIKRKRQAAKVSKSGFLAEGECRWLIRVGIAV